MKLSIVIPCCNGEKNLAAQLDALVVQEWSQPWEIIFADTLPYLHDTDFCFRAQQAGYKLIFVPDAVLRLRRRDSLIGNFRQSRNYAEYNTILARRYWGKNDSAGPFYRRFIGEWFGLLFSVRDLRRKIGRFYWMWRCGSQVGRLRGLVLRRGIPV